METKLPRRNHFSFKDHIVDEHFFDTPEGFQLTDDLFDADGLEEALKEVEKRRKEIDEKQESLEATPQ